MSQSTPSRRRFLQQSLAASAAMGFPAVLRAANLNSMLQVAMVGANGMAFADMTAMGSHPKVKFVGFCDIDANRFARADKSFPGVPHFADYVEMYSKLGDTLDAVGVAIPDHSHARAGIEAMKRGKHVYCQKPLAHTVWECRQMNLWAKKTGVITQMGNQIHSAIEYRLGVRLIRDGAIGKVKEVHSWVGVDGRERQMFMKRPPKSLESTPPANVNWDLWIGPAPMRGFVADTYHPFVWRDWQDFGSGALGDFGCHIFDPVFTALELTAPLTVRAEHGGTNREVWPGPQRVYYTFPGTKWTSGPINVTWHDGHLQPPAALAQMPADQKLPGGGSLLIGELGTMVLPHVGKPKLYPADKFADHVIPKDVKGLEHRHVWIDHVFANEKTSDGFHYAGPLAEAVQLGNVAARFPGQTLEWDAVAMKITIAGKPHAAAEALLSKDDRKGYEVSPVSAV
jgi:predicted dehydrogenase